MIKKLLAALVAVTIVFSPVGNFVFQDVQQTEVSAKKYRSGSKGFKPAPSQNQNINRQQQNNNTVNNRANTPTRNTGGFMGGLMMGGLAGLLFGGLLAGMGGFGPILGMMINILAIVVIFMLIGRIITAIKNRNRTREEDQWRR